MPTDTVKFERRGAVAVITLNRSEQANSLRESEAVATQAQSAEGREGTAAFLGKRAPVFVPSSLGT